MSRMMIQAAVTMSQTQNKMDLIGHNLANTQTPGYKAQKVEFSSLLKQQINNLNTADNAPGRLTPDGIRVGTGARLGAIKTDLSIGAFQTTGRELDVVLPNKNHFFQVATDNNGVMETNYSRDGSFYLQEFGGGLMLVTGDGNPVLGANGERIILPTGNYDAINITENGEIMISRDNTSEYVATIAVTEFVRPEVLETTGDNLYQLPDLDALGYAMDEILFQVGNAGRLMESGLLEQSNVNVAEQMTDLILAQRAYQLNARTITTSDQMMGLVTQLRS